MTLENCIYRGKVYHKRYGPKKHSFSYKVFNLYLNIAKMNNLSKTLSLFSINKFNIFSFYYKDHGPIGCKNLNSWIKNSLKKNGIICQVHNIYILCYPRIFGYVFNPLSVYYCYDKFDNIIAEVYEVHNTFKQRHFYIISPKKKNKVKKSFHVSPFMKINGNYSLKSNIKKNDIYVEIIYKGHKEKLFASFYGKKNTLHTKNLVKVFFIYPLMTLKIILGIHLEALRLLLKGVRFNKTPKPPKKSITTNLKTNL